MWKSFIHTKLFLLWNYLRVPIHFYSENSEVLDTFQLLTTYLLLCSPITVSLNSRIFGLFSFFVKYKHFLLFKQFKKVFNDFILLSTVIYLPDIFAPFIYLIWICKGEQFWAIYDYDITLAITMSAREYVWIISITQWLSYRVQW